MIGRSVITIELVDLLLLFLLLCSSHSPIGPQPYSQREKQKTEKNTARDCQSGSWSAGQGNKSRKIKYNNNNNNNEKITKSKKKTHDERKIITDDRRKKLKWLQETGTAPLERI